MPCTRPLTAYRCQDGSITFVENLARHDVVAQLQLPCSQCLGCRLDRARDWSVRLTQEARLHRQTAFLTLTYSDENVPPYGSLHYPHFQRFMKRYRRQAQLPLRFFMCGEYGGQTERPHYHAIIFGHDFADKKPWKRNSHGHVLYISEQLDALWQLGHCSIGEVNPTTTGYVARYCTKKVTGDLAEMHYAVVDPATGELNWRQPEFAHMSLKPGIGAIWYSKYGRNDLHEYDFTVQDGKKYRVPKYYDKLLKRNEIEQLEKLKHERYLKGKERWENNTDERLKVREEVLKARTKSLKREL